jgi:Mn-containing catalase
VKIWGFFIFKRLDKLNKNYKNMKSGGPDGELGASLRYLSQRYTMPYKEIKGILYICILYLRNY